MNLPPPLTGILEAALYVKDLERSKRFYSETLRLAILGEQPGRHLFYQVGANTVLLLFIAEATRQGGAIAPHGTDGEGHVAFNIGSADAWETWRDHLQQQGVPIEQEIVWGNGSVSLYFRDPDNNSLELTTTATWPFQSDTNR